ncbi:centrosomal protein of 295 kDa [Lampris incognitus]|uniref:centrosomal protein of 295 kDa n=1 Tax=Lampris incognitus TaxID=2546036 RepID=UPI0024B635EE|nr:centrosomal protein of 295 kDa [Lampris incognitus]
MKRKVSRLRLSPNEEAQLIREEYERRRKLRIQQVREQQRNIALQIRHEVQQRRERELQNLAEELRQDWERQQKEKIETLQTLYQDSLQLLGQGHRDAKENEPDWEGIAQREEENHAKAKERYREALRELKSQRQKDHEELNRPINARKRALQAEKERSAKVASLPPPPPNPIETLDSKRLHIVRKADVKAFSSTHYHRPETTVDREVNESQPSAHELAEMETQRLQELGKEAERERGERLEKARLRGKHALWREQLMQDRERLLVQLEHMQQTDLLRRRQQACQIPAQIFRPLPGRQEEEEEHQREMEFAFEDIYTGERRVKGDLVLQLTPEPLPALSTDSQDQELDLTLDSAATPLEDTAGTEDSHPDARQQRQQAELETAEQAKPSRPGPRQALKKLLSRIRIQQDQWSSHSSQGYHQAHVDDHLTADTDQIPERDTTIDTGSLTSEERGQERVAPGAPRFPVHSELPQATEDESILAGTSLPADEQADPMQDSEEERTRREGELEGEKQQQIALLQELEEQRAGLERMLQEAQQERENLKAAVTQDAPTHQQEVPVHDQEVTSLTPGPAAETVSTAREGGHTRRIREYQQRLLEQNRLHKRSVEGARQRLEEYQRALRIRHMSSALVRPPAVPAGPIRPLPHSGGSSIPLVPALQRPTSSALPVHIPCTDDRTQVQVETPTRVSASFAPSVTLSSLVLHPRASLGVEPVFQPVQPELSAGILRDQTAGITARLTDSIIERVTKHLSKNLRPSSISTDFPLHGPFTASDVPLPPVSHPLRVTSPSQADVSPLLSGRAPVKQGTLQLGSQASTQEDIEMRRRELLEAQRQVLAQREAMAQQLREQEVQRHVEEEARRRYEEEKRQRHEEDRRRQEEERRRKCEEEQRWRHEEEKRWRYEEEERQRRQEDKWRQEEERRWEEERRRCEEEERRRREDEERRRQEEERPRWEEQMVQMRRQKEVLQALINIDEQPAPQATTEVLDSEDIGESRLRLLSSLLRAIEEANGGSLSHLQSNSENQQPSTRDLTAQSLAPPGPALPPHLHPAVHLPPRPPKPPVTRVRLGPMEMMAEQHELSAIQEVETPANASLVTGTEDIMKGPLYTLAGITHRDPEPSVASNRPLHTSSISSGRQHSVGRGTNFGTGSEGSSKFSWRETSVMEAGTSLQPSQPEPAVQFLSPPSSDSGVGAAESASLAAVSFRSLTESAHRPPDPDCLSSTISTGSYITTDPEQNSTHSADNAALLLLPRPGLGRGRAGLLDVSPPSSHDSYKKDQSVVGSAGPTVDFLFHDSSIQRIIDKYTRELNVSLNTAGSTTVCSEDRGDSHVEEASSSETQQSWAGVLDEACREERPADSQSLPSDTESVAQKQGLEWDNTVNQILERFSGQVSVLAQEQDSSFRPLIGQLADQSSYLAAEQRESAMERLIGQPSAHSSMIAQLLGQSASAATDQAGLDSPPSRVIGRLSHQLSSDWPNSGQDFSASQLIGQQGLEQSSTWLDSEGQEHSRMRPLVGELDESAPHRNGSSGERASINLDGSAQVCMPSGPVSSPEARPHNSSVPGLSPLEQSQQSRTSPQQPDPEMSEMFLACDSFYPLLAEVTQNETADASMTFHLPQQEELSSPEGDSRSSGKEGSLSAHCEGSPEEKVETRDNVSTESYPSPERFRAEEPSPSPTTLQESFCQLTTSQCRPNDSALVVSPADQDAELMTLSLSNLMLNDASPTLDPLLAEGRAAKQDGVQDHLGHSVQTCDSGSAAPNDQKCPNLSSIAPVWEEIMETASEKGILEQSEITLVSLTESTLLDQKRTITDEEDEEEKEGCEEEKDESQKVEKEELESTLFPKDNPGAVEEKENSQQRTVMLLEFQCSPGKGQLEAFQQKRRVLVQRSNHRVEEIKARRVQADTQKTSTAKCRQPNSCKARTNSEPPPGTKSGQAASKTADASCLVTAGKSEEKLQPTPLVTHARLKKVDEVRICTPEQRKRDFSDMRQRTQRLYEQLEEVKHQKEVKSRQAFYATNRLKVKEFHKKTLQKLRVKQTPQ